MPIKEARPAFTARHFMRPTFATPTVTQSAPTLRPGIISYLPTSNPGASHSDYRAVFPNGRAGHVAQLAVEILVGGSV